MIEMIMPSITIYSHIFSCIYQILQIFVMTHVDPANEQLDPLTKGVLGGIEYDGNGFELL